MEKTVRYNYKLRPGKAAEARLLREAELAMLVSGAMWINFGILGAYSFWQMLPVGIVLTLLSSALSKSA